jgi:UDP-N-acetylmuramoyl-tripeptide--D-alanyl-D-alanine ligase
MAELGQQAEQLHAELGTSIAQAGVQLMLAVGKLAGIAAASAESNARNNLQIKCFPDTISARNNLNEFVKDYDIILIKGSRTAKLETVVERLKELFSHSEPRELTKQM